MTHHTKTRALVLKSMKWRDSSKIVTLFTETNGRIKVIAHGAARGKSPFRGKIETLNLIEAVISFRDSRSLQILKEISLVEDFRKVKGDFVRTTYAFAMLEIIDQIFEEEDTDNTLFQFIITLIQNIGVSCKSKLIWWFFLLKLASYLGFKPNFESCATCGTRNIGRAYFSFRDGVIYCQNCLVNEGPVRILNPEEWDFLEKLQKKSYKTIGIETEMSLPEFDFSCLFLDYLNHHIGYSLTMKSLELLK